MVVTDRRDYGHGPECPGAGMEVQPGTGVPSGKFRQCWGSARAVGARREVGDHGRAGGENGAGPRD